MPSVAEIRARRPREVVIARALAISAAALWIPAAGTYPQLAGVYGLTMIVYLHGSFGAAKGRQGARIQTTIALALLYFFLLPYIPAGFARLYPSGPEFATMATIAACAGAVGLVLLYVPRSNRYFREITIARRAEKP